MSNLQDISSGQTSWQVSGKQGRIDEEFNLILKENTLSPGSYKFRIDVVTESCSASSDTEIVINSAPSAGNQCTKIVHTV